MEGVNQALQIMPWACMDGGDKNIIYNSQQIAQVTHFTGKLRAENLSQNKSPLKTPQIKFTWGFQAQNICKVFTKVLVY